MNIIHPRVHTVLSVMIPWIWGHTWGPANVATKPSMTIELTVMNNFCQLNGLTIGNGGSCMLDWRNLWNGSACIPLTFRYYLGRGILSGEVVFDRLIVRRQFGTRTGSGRIHPYIGSRLNSKLQLIVYKQLEGYPHENCSRFCKIDFGEKHAIGLGMRFPPTLRNNRKFRVKFSTQRTLMLGRKSGESDYRLESWVSMGKDWWQCNFVLRRQVDRMCVHWVWSHLTVTWMQFLSIAEDCLLRLVIPGQRLPLLWAVAAGYACWTDVIRNKSTWSICRSEIAQKLSSWLSSELHQKHDVQRTSLKLTGIVSQHPEGRPKKYSFCIELFDDWKSRYTIPCIFDSGSAIHRT